MNVAITRTNCPRVSVTTGVRVPGTNYELDAVQGAFNIGAMILWLDFNDTWLAAEGGHPSDNLGGILATAGNLSRLAIANDGKAITIEDVLIDLIKALEIQGCISLEIL
jgi:2-methylcitrate dehydratase